MIRNKKIKTAMRQLAVKQSIYVIKTVSYRYQNSGERARNHIEQWAVIEDINDGNSDQSSETTLDESFAPAIDVITLWLGLMPQRGRGNCNSNDGAGHEIKSPSDRALRREPNFNP